MAFLSFPYGWPWGISWDAPPPPPEFVRTCGRSYADVITKFSRLDGLPVFLTHGASLARFARWSSAMSHLCIMGQGKLVMVLVQLTFMKQLCNSDTTMQKLQYMILKFILDNEPENARTALSIFCPISPSETWILAKSCLLWAKSNTNINNLIVACG